MEVILREHVNNLGRIGDIVVVKPGYARNFLFPQSLAVRATQENKAMIEAKRKELEAIEEGHRQEARERAKPFAGIALTLSVAVTEEGNLFGSVGERDILKALQDRGLEIEKSEILMPQGSIQQIGTYPVVLRFFYDVEEEITVTVEANQEESQRTAKASIEPEDAQDDASTAT